MIHKYINKIGITCVVYTSIKRRNVTNTRATAPDVWRENMRNSIMCVRRPGGGGQVRVTTLRRERWPDSLLHLLVTSYKVREKGKRISVWSKY